MSESYRQGNFMLLAYDNGEILQSCLQENIWINTMLKTTGITFSNIFLWELSLASEWREHNTDGK